MEYKFRVNLNGDIAVDDGNDVTIIPVAYWGEDAGADDMAYASDAQAFWAWTQAEGHTVDTRGKFSLQNRAC